MPKRQKRPQEEEAPSSEEEENAPTSSDSSSEDDFPSGGEDSEPSSDDEAGEAFESVDVDFGFYCPQEGDAGGLRTLLAGYLDGQQWAASELADAIIRQARSMHACRRRAACRRSPPPPTPDALPLVPPTGPLSLPQGDAAGVGSVIKCGDEEEPIGVSTVLSLARHGGLKPLCELRAFLAAAAGEHRRRLEAAWDAPGTGLVVNERLVNCPPELAEPLQESLFGEVAEAAEDEELPQVWGGVCGRGTAAAPVACSPPCAGQALLRGVQANASGGSSVGCGADWPRQQGAGWRCRRALPTPAAPAPLSHPPCLYRRSATSSG